MFAVAIWIFVACIAKILFHIYKQVSEMFPDSSLLIMVGLVIGITLNALQVKKTEFTLTSGVFMYYLLPPLVFDAGYNAPARQFFDNFGSCLTFALDWNGICTILSQSADVDPVAVIVIFEEMNVNELLFISVFGESLLNDGISVVLYRMFNVFVEIGAENLITQDYIFGVISFFVIALGGTIAGLLFAMLTAFVTKYTDKVPILNPVFVFLIPFMSYLGSEMVSISAIMAIVFCGVIMKPYIRENISKDAFKSIHYFVKVLALASETVIFIFLGLSTVSVDHHWDTPFIVLTVIFCVLYRALSVVVLCWFLNKVRLKKFTKGRPVHYCFRLEFKKFRTHFNVAILRWTARRHCLRSCRFIARYLYVTACIVVIYFTVFLQGVTLKPIANFLQVERKVIYEKSMIEKVHGNLIDNTMILTEIIIGKKGHHWIRNTFDQWNAKYLRPLLIKTKARRHMDNTNLVRAANQLAAKDALNFADQMQSWYEYTRSRANSESSLPPNGSIMHGGSVIIEDDKNSEWSDEDDGGTSPPHLPSILKNEDGEEINRFARF
ncbi:Cation H+ exchanger domain containing protein [Aphelenchoides bicaudatus]|nr:Cation H+ exchanger domain containing protein [Aphelenchoides bicaudatus]